MKGTMEATGTEGARRGLFSRRSRRSDAGESERPVMSTDDAVATVDELARRMEQLTASVSIADDPVRAEFDLQRAVIARANDLAAAGGAFANEHPVAAPAATAATPTSTTSIAPEAHVPQPAHDTADTTDLAPLDDADIQARLDAALQPVRVPVPVAVPSPSGDSVTLEPTAAPAPVAHAPAAELAPTQQQVSTAGFVPTASTTGAAAKIGIDIQRVVALIEDEAAGVQHRLELEVRNAHAQAEQIVDRAEDEAERIREHGQAQARVLLGEVEEIISEAQATGEQILHRASDEASSLRSDATAVLQQAQSEARAIVDTARREGEQVLAEQRRLATVRAQEAMREQDRLKDQIRRLEERRRQVLESLEPLISQLTQMMPAGIAAEHNVVQLQRSGTQQ